MAEHIQIGDVTPRIQYSGDGTQSVFTYPFPIFEYGDLEVYEDAVIKALSSDYTVQGAGESTGGTVNLHGTAGCEYNGYPPSQCSHQTDQRLSGVGGIPGQRLER